MIICCLRQPNALSVAHKLQKSLAKQWAGKRDTDKHKWFTYRKKPTNLNHVCMDSDLIVTTQGRGLGVTVDISLKLLESGGL